MTAPGYGAGTRKPLTPSAHIQGEALSSASYWAGQRHQMFPRTPSTIDKELNGPNQLHNLSRSPLQSPHDNNLKKISFFIEATKTLCHSLSNGMENPLAFIDYCNQTYEYNGLPIINIPQWIIDSSRDTFLRKSMVNNPSNHVPQHPPPDNPPVSPPPETPIVPNPSVKPPISTPLDTPPVSTPDPHSASSPVSSTQSNPTYTPSLTTSSTTLTTASSTNNISNSNSPTTTTTTTSISSQSSPCPTPLDPPSNFTAPPVSSATSVSEVAYLLRSKLVISTPKPSTQTSPSYHKHQANISTSNRKLSA